MRSLFVLLAATLSVAGCGAPAGGEGKGNGSVPRSDLPLETDTNWSGSVQANLAGASLERPTGSPEATGR